MQNVINKPFQIERGGFIRWNGDPYDANINISAIYKTKAGLYDLFQDSTFKKSVPVNLQLRLTDKLFNPNIAFDIKVQNVDPTIETQINKLINTEEEKYRQAMALIIARRFTTPSALSDRGTVSSGGVVGSNAYELLSNQLSNWASQISNQFNVNVSYNPGDEITTEQFEVGVQRAGGEPAVLAGGEDEEALAAFEEQGRGEGPFGEDFWVVGEEPAAEIDGKWSGGGDFDPVGAVAVVVFESAAVVGEEFGDVGLLGGHFLVEIARAGLGWTEQG